MRATTRPHTINGYERTFFHKHNLIRPLIFYNLIRSTLIILINGKQVFISIHLFEQIYRVIFSMIFCHYSFLQQSYFLLLYLQLLVSYKFFLKLLSSTTLFFLPFGYKCIKQLARNFMTSGILKVSIFAGYVVLEQLTITRQSSSLDGMGTVQKYYTVQLPTQRVQLLRICFGQVRST